MRQEEPKSLNDLYANLSTLRYSRAYKVEDEQERRDYDKAIDEILKKIRRLKNPPPKKAVVKEAPSWADLLDEELSKNGESREDIVFYRDRFPFVVWTHECVYFPVVGEKKDWVGSIIRNPETETCGKFGAVKPSGSYRDAKIQR